MGGLLWGSDVLRFCRARHCLLRFGFLNVVMLFRVTVLVASLLTSLHVCVLPQSLILSVLGWMWEGVEFESGNCKIECALLKGIWMCNCVIMLLWIFILLLLFFHCWHFQYSLFCESKKEIEKVRERQNFVINAGWLWRPSYWWAGMNVPIYGLARHFQLVVLIAFVYCMHVCVELKAMEVSLTH